MNTSNINPSVLLLPFQRAIGPVYDKIVNDTKSWLGRLDKDIVSKGGSWKTGTKGAIVNKEGHRLQLPLNNPMSSLVLFSLDLRDIATRAGFGGEYGTTDADGVIHTGMQIDLPTVCKAWIEKEQADFAPFLAAAKK